ncbi:MAG: hypothetical protein A2289_21975 [Deltaproteobacteria bacterium RIFOXYA12_FULL_58_15]|nr:MAG: hypothetical protein A2289_21975 [Deltaproteobacteria bacterium RIFOXYA12_FULL_58_15]OGR08361.1 MAG: hypothetical protein A2341_25185 [Deltaproteobacteria bacterium RIFOXYB12_FULL_58_9]
MLSLLFSLSFLLCLALLLWRWWMKKRRLALRMSAPGMRRDNPVRVERFDDIDTTVSAVRCDCGGRISATAEGSLAVGETSLRVVHAECGDCESNLTLYFDCSRLLH